MKIWLAAATLTYPQAGGHLWVYLNWALGLRALGCDVVWLEACDANLPVSVLQGLVSTLKQHLEPYGLEKCVALCPHGEGLVPAAVAASCVDWERAEEADLLINLSYSQ